MEENELQNQSPNPENQKEDPLPDIVLSSIRTYKSDINQTVEKDKITTAKILLAEQKRRTNDADSLSENSVKKPKNILVLILGIVLVVIAVGAIGFFGYTKVLNPAPVATFTPETFFLFAFDKEEKIDTQKTNTEVLQSVTDVIQKANQSPDNTYTDIVLYKTDPDTKQSSRISSGDFFKLYQVKLPDSISRSISKDFAYGLYKTNQRVEPFIVLGLSDYENAYDSMFSWESTLAIDLKDFFPNLQKIFVANQPVPAEQVTGTTTADTASSTATTTVTASTTPPAAYVPTNRNVQFVDVVLSNRDTRAIRDENGTPYFYYTFIDKDKILFAQDPKLITEITRKIREKQLVR